MKSKYIGAALAVVLWLASIGVQVAYGAPEEPTVKDEATTVKIRQCGSFNTDQLRQDLKDQATRQDNEWRDMLLNMLAWQLDCERGKNNGQ